MGLKKVWILTTGGAVAGPLIDEDENDLEETEAKPPAVARKLAETRSSDTSVSAAEEDLSVSLKSEVTSCPENPHPTSSHSPSQSEDAPANPSCSQEESPGMKGAITEKAVDVDQIIIEIANKPQVGFESKPQGEFLFLSKRLEQAHVEQFLAFHSWNTVTSMNAFQDDPFVAMKEAGIELPSDTDVKNAELEDDPETTMCLICCDEMNTSSEDWVELRACNHAFCSECLGNYISECARSRDVGVTIKCPHHECSIPLSRDELEKLVQSPDIYECLLKASDEKFVASSEDLCFCPFAGCDKVVRKLFPAFAASAKLDRNLLGLCGAVCTGAHTTMEANHCPLTYDGIPDPFYRMTKHAIQPKKPHRFCFVCGSQTIHWPIKCDDLEQWKEKIANEIAELDEGDEQAAGGDFNDVAQRLWMKANTRPCPKCKAPIEKNDGCNHMTCSNRNCRHEFCWICREDWKLHNTETGGFFRCNRWQADDQYYDSKSREERRPPETGTADASSSEEYGTSLHSSRTAWKKAKDMGLFLHNYRRWIAHKESAELERQMAETVCTRLAPVVEAAIDFNGHESFDFGGIGLSFIHAAFTELLECRSLLQHSYAFAFFRYPIQYHMPRDRLAKSKEREKLAFEQRQSELEMLTEQTSDIVARKHLRATQMQIMFVTKSAFQKRRELTSFMLSLLNEQLKETKADAERAEREKNKPTVERFQSIFDLFVRDFPLRHQHQPYHINRDHEPSRLGRFMDDNHHHQTYQTNRDHESSHLRRLMEDHQRSIHRGRREWYDFDDRDEFRVRSGRIRTGFLEEDTGHDVGRSNVHHFTPFVSDDIRNTDNIPRFQDWACNECTYMNAVGHFCAMCGTSRR
jgi:IBR domain, a half RING-finger domain/Ariadne domain